MLLSKKNQGNFNKSQGTLFYDSIHTELNKYYRAFSTYLELVTFIYWTFKTTHLKQYEGNK